MALLDFPTGPNTNDTTTQNGNTWKWNGTSWVAFNNLSLSSQVSGILAVQYGGTGFGGTYTAGDILYALSSNTFGKLAAGTAGSVLASGGPSTAPYWKLDEAGSGSVGNGNTGGFAYYTNVNNVTSGTAFSYISGTNNVILTNGTLSLTGSTVNSGTWAGNAISLVYGGTNNNLSGIGQSYQLAFYNATGTAITALTTGSGIANSILYQANNSSAPIWVGQSQLSVGSATSSASVVTDAVTATRFLIGTVLNSASSGGTVLSTGSGITIGNNLLTSAGIAITGSTASTSTSTGALVVSGGVGIGGSLWTNGSTVSSISGVSHQNGAITGGTWAGTAVSLTYGGTNANLTASAGAVVYSTATAFALSAVGTAGSILQSANTGAPIWVGQSSLSVGTATSSASVVTDAVTATRYLIGTVLNSASTGGTLLSTGSGITIGNNLLTSAGIAVTGSTASTSTTTGALVVSGGVGIGGSLWTNGSTVSSISGVSHQNGAITGGTWAGTAVSLTYGGTNANLTASAGAVVYSTSTAFALSAVGTAGSILQSANTGAPIWVGQSSLSVGSATTSNTSINLNTYSLSGTMYLTGQTSSSGVATGSSQFVGSGISFNSVSGLLTATSYAGSGILLSGIVTSLAASTGISVNSATGAVTVTNTGVISLTGTANQVLVAGGSGSATSGNITLSLPQSIASTSSPSFADVTLTTGSNSTLATVGSQPTSMVNKQYVDNLAAGLDIHESMRVLQSSALSANYVQTQGAGSAATSAYLISTTQVALPAIDGITISATGTSQRVLVVGGFTGTASIAGTTPFTPGNSFIGNGSYFVVALGGAGTSNWILRRTTDADDNVELTGGTFTFIEEGTSYSDSGWVCSNDTLNLGSIQFGSTPITFTQFTGGGAISVGQGLTKVGNTVATKVNLFSTGTASGTGFTQFNIGGAGSAGVADTGYYPTFTVRTSGTVAGTAVLTLNSDGFSLVGSTNNSRTITVTGSDITLTGGGNTLTLTGSISLPSPTQYGIAYGSSATAVSFLTAAGTGASVLTQTLNNNPVYLAQSQLSVGIANSSVLLNTTADTTSTLYLLGTKTNGGFAGTAIFVDTGISALGNTITAVTFSGTATTATRALNTDITGDTTSTIYLTGSRSSSSIGSTPVYVLSGVSALGNTITATTFSGTASIASSSILLNTTTDTTSTLYLLGTKTNGGFAGTAIFVDTGISALGNTITATTFSGSLAGTAAIATSSVLLNTTADTTSTLYLLGTKTNGGFAGTAIFVDTGISALGNTITAVTFSGTATTATRALNTDITGDTTSTIYLTGSRSSSSIGSTPTYVLSGVSALGNTITATTFSGSLAGTAAIASSSILLNTTADTTSTLYLLGTRTNGGFAGTAIFVDTGISALGNTITATTFSGTATTATRALNTDITGDTTSTIYLTGSRSSSSIGSTPVYVLSGVSALGNTITATTFSGTASIASSSILLNTTADTASTLYLLGTKTNGGFAGTAIFVDTGISALGNTITAVTFSGSLSGTASTATRVGITTNVDSANYPIVFANAHQPSAALGSSTLLTYNPSTGKITNGFWAGTAITTPYGGTGLNTVNANQVLIGASTGNTWAAIASTNLPVAAISTTPPTQPGGAIGGTQPGQLWWDSEYGVLKVYYNDGNTSQWVDATPVLGSSGGGSSTKRSYVMTFGAGFTPSTGADTVQILIPYAPDNTAKYYFIKRLDYRANTAGTGVSFYIERFTGGNAAFDVSSGNRIHSASGASFVAASGIFITSYTQSSSGASFVSSSGIAGSILSGDYLRLNYSHINSAATMSVSIIIEEQ